MACILVNLRSLPTQDKPEELRQLVYDWDMWLIMNDGQLQTVGQVRQFLRGSEVVKFRGLMPKEKYCWVEDVLIKFRYHRLNRSEQGVIQRYVQRGLRDTINTFYSPL